MVYTDCVFALYPGNMVFILELLTARSDGTCPAIKENDAMRHGRLS